MKKIVLIIISVLILSGCQNIKKLNYTDVLNTLATPSQKANVYRQGYKYYLPRGVAVASSSLFNEILTSDGATYYLYVDGVSFNKKLKKEYQETTKSLYSKKISYQDKYGYVEINKYENAKYLVEIMYNYAKIEVIVDKDDISKALFTCVSILKSISYNEEIIANLFGKDVLNYKEEEFNIFNTTSSDSTYMEIDDTYEDVEEEVIPDTDLIN